MVGSVSTNSSGPCEDYTRAYLFLLLPDDWNQSSIDPQFHYIDSDQNFAELDRRRANTTYAVGDRNNLGKSQFRVICRTPGSIKVRGEAGRVQATIVGLTRR